MGGGVNLALLLIVLVFSPLCQAQTIIDKYGFYRSWKELNDRYFDNEVVLDERGLELGTNTDTSKLSDQGQYQVSVEPANISPSAGAHTAPPFNQIHTWLVSVQPVGSEPTDDLTVEFYGGMPLHNHGFPTAPQIAKTTEPGVFYLHGIKFSMMGWWQFAFAIKNDEIVDTVRINLVIEP